MSNNINVEEIMQEIKKEIQEKGYTNELLKFDDIVVDASSMEAVKFDKKVFEEQLYLMNRNWNVQVYRVLSGSAISTFFKKVIRKMLYFLLDPIVAEQDNFNASVVRTMNQMNCYLEETKRENEELKKTIKDLNIQIKGMDNK